MKIRAVDSVVIGIEAHRMAGLFLDAHPGVKAANTAGEWLAAGCRIVAGAIEVEAPRAEVAATLERVLAFDSEVLLTRMATLDDDSDEGETE